jgi:CDP-glycerol:poly(glycerophosphate) glycerophosphotransferase
MKQNILIITEDVVKTQTLKGTIGQLYSRLYIFWLKLRIKLFTSFFSNQKVTLVTSDCFELKKIHTKHYSHELSKLDYSKNRQFYLQISDQLFNLLSQLDSQATSFKNIPLTNLLKTRLTIYITYHYLVYVELFEKLIKDIKPNKIITLGNSSHEQIAKLLAQKIKIEHQSLSFLSLAFVNHWLQRFFLKREYQQKLETFIYQSDKPLPPKSQLENAAILSVDFFRHLKTLVPVYRQLKKLKKNPWFAANDSNIQSTLKNFNISKPKYFYLASLLSSNNITKQKDKLLEEFNSLYIKAQFQLKSNHDCNQQLTYLCLDQLQSMISYGLTLSSLYLQAADKLFIDYKPRSVVVVSDSRFSELALAISAKKHKVQSILTSPNAFFDLAQINHYDTTDHISVIGDFIKHELIKQGTPASKIHVSGDLRLESLQPSQVKSQSQVYKLLNIKDTSKKIILLISFRSNWIIPQKEKQAFFQMSYQAVKNNKDTILVVKPHPTEKRWRLEQTLKSWGMTNAILSDNHQLELFDLLNTSSVVLQTWSMTIFESIMVNRPVISINPEKKDYNFFLPIIKPGGAIEVFSQKQLNHWLKILINPTHPQTKQQLAKAKKACIKFIKHPDGKAAQRVVKLLS